MWPVSLCCVLGQDTLLYDLYSFIVGTNSLGNLIKCWGVTCDGIALYATKTGDEPYGHMASPIPIIGMDFTLFIRDRMA